MELARCSNQPTLPSSSDNSKSRLGFCEVCARQTAKYTCPRCEVKTCSLNCSKIHKIEVECNGERDKVKFIPMNKFTNLDLSSDYRLLEEISRVVDTSKKRKIRNKSRLNHRCFKLQQEAARNKVTVKFLPNTFARHKTNTSYYRNDLKMILWHVEWVFVSSDNLRLVDEKVPENTKISTIFHKYLIQQDNRELQEKLQYYQAADLPGIKLLLRAEGKSNEKFYELDATNTLRESLKNKLIIEYPIIHVVLKDQANFYEIIDTDDEDNTKRNGQEVIRNLINHSENDDSHTNLLFASNYSDSD